MATKKKKTKKAPKRKPSKALESGVLAAQTRLHQAKDSERMVSGSDTNDKALAKHAVTAAERDLCYCTMLYLHPDLFEEIEASEDSERMRTFFDSLYEHAWVKDPVILGTYMHAIVQTPQYVGSVIGEAAADPRSYGQ
jgi:ferredoxin-thioredoxin reductase catalytic subunit